MIAAGPLSLYATRLCRPGQQRPDGRQIHAHGVMCLRKDAVAFGGGQRFQRGMYRCHAFGGWIGLCPGNGKGKRMVRPQTGRRTGDGVKKAGFGIGGCCGGHGMCLHKADQQGMGGQT